MLVQKLEEAEVIEIVEGPTDSYTGRTSLPYEWCKILHFCAHFILLNLCDSSQGSQICLDKGMRYCLQSSPGHIEGSSETNEIDCRLLQIAGDFYAAYLVVYSAVNRTSK